jgi:hypothetical protein
MRIRVFQAKRKTGCFIDGVEFEDGTTVVHWNSKWASTSIYKSYADFEELQLARQKDELEYYVEGYVDLEPPVYG